MVRIVCLNWDCGFFKVFKVVFDNVFFFWLLYLINCGYGWGFIIKIIKKLVVCYYVEFFRMRK